MIVSRAVSGKIRGQCLNSVKAATMHCQRQGECNIRVVSGQCQSSPSALSMHCQRTVRGSVSESDNAVSG